MYVKFWKPGPPSRGRPSLTIRREADHIGNYQLPGGFSTAPRAPDRRRSYSPS